jgi:lipoprotein-releasing system permease protein
VARAPGVTAVSPLIEDKIGISSKEVRDGVLVRGIDLDREVDVTDIRKNLKFGGLNLGSVLSARSRENPGILLGSYVADRLRIIVGDEVIVMSLRGEEDVMAGILPKMKRMTVSGLYESGMYEYDANLAFVSIESAKDLLETGGISAVQVKVQNVLEAGRVAQALQDTLGYPYFCVDWMRQNRNLIKWMNFEKLIAFVAISMIILVAIFNIISSLLMVIVEKMGEIGILLSMGAGRRSIMRIFLINGMSVGVLGTLAGVVVGLGICFLQIKFNFIKLPREIYLIESFPVIVKWLDVVLVVGTANLLCFVFSLYPAYKAAKLRPVETLKYQ